MRKEKFGQILKDSEVFRNLHVDQIYFSAKTYTLGGVMAACRKINIELTSAEITNLMRRFIDA